MDRRVNLGMVWVESNRRASPAAAMGSKDKYV